MIDFRVLGPLELKGPDGEEILSVLSQPKRVALLAYLALATDQGFRRRDTIIGLFWPDLDQERARGALRKSLYFLRRSLGEEALKGRGDEEVSLDWDQVSCDAVDFQDALEKGDLERALELYRGELLEGLFLSGSPEFERWLDAERERLREIAASAAWELAHIYLSSGRVTDGERLGQRALGLVPTDENEVQRFIQALNDVGDRAAAVRFYEKFAKELEDLLDLRPAAETRALVKGIRDTRGTPAPLAGSTPSTGRSEAELAPKPPPGHSPEPPPEPPPDPALRSQLFDRVKEALSSKYGVEEEIGRGGMATVFLAHDPKHRRKVALKVLDPELAQALGADRFLQEIEIAANLTHPHILPLFDSGEADGLLYYVMPYVEGESLRSRLEREKQLPVAAAVTIAREVASALAFAHEKGVIHRDVKPANILLEAGHAVLADFGIAHAVSLAGESRHTRSGTSLGTPAYMSPEQSTGEADLDGRSDQYGLGCVLYEMLAGDQPFRGPTGESVARQHLTREPPAITELRPSVPDGVAYALQRAMEKAPADRFPGMGAFSDALEADASGVTQPSHTAAGGQTRGPFGTLPRTWTIAALGLVLLLGALGLRRVFRGLDGPTTPAPGGRIVLAVMPFADLASDREELFSEKMATWLGMALDDVGGIRTVDRNALFSLIGHLPPGERLSPADAREAAVGLRATHFILGEAIGEGDEGLTVTATPYTVDDDPAEVPRVLSVVGSSHDLSTLADALAEQLLDHLPVAPGERLSGVAAVTSGIESARAAYLRGEEEFRATRYAEAYESFDEAVKVDPSFALAHYRKSLTAVMILKFDQARLAAFDAMDHRQRLKPREQSLVRAWETLIRGSAEEAKGSYRRILEDYPDEVEAHFGLGTAQVYYNPTLGDSIGEARDQFERVLELAPNFGQARFHLLEFATRDRNEPAFDSLMTGVDPTSDQALAWDAVRAFWLGDQTDQRGLEARFLRANSVDAGLAIGRVAAFLQNHRAARRLAALLTGPDQANETRAAAHLLVAMTHFAQGQWAEGMASLNDAERFSPGWAIEMKALFTGFPYRAPASGELQTLRGSLLDWDGGTGSSTNFVLFAHNGYHRYIRTYLLGLTSVWMGETETAHAYADSLGTMPRNLDYTVVTRSWAQGITARAFAAAGDTADAISLLSIPPAPVPLWLISISPFFSRSFDRYALGELLMADGQFEEALRWFRSLTEGHELVLVAPAFRQMALIEEILERPEEARAHFIRFVELWEDADPEFQALVTEAEQRIADLTVGS